MSFEVPVTPGRGPAKSAGKEIRQSVRRGCKWNVARRQRFNVESDWQGHGGGRSGYPCVGAVGDEWP